MRLQYRLLKKFDNKYLLEVCSLKWQRDSTRNPQEAEKEDITSVEWQYLGTLLVSSVTWEFIKNGNIIIDNVE